MPVGCSPATPPKTRQSCDKASLSSDLSMVRFVCTPETAQSVPCRSLDFEKLFLQARPPGATSMWKMLLKPSISSCTRVASGRPTT